MSADVVVVDLLGLVLIGAIVWYFFLSRRPESREAQQADGVQEIRVTVKGGYSPDVIVARAGVPLRLHFDRQEESPCSEEVVFPHFGVRRHLPAFATTRVDLPAATPGSYGFACGMDMLHGTLVVSAKGEPVVAPAPVLAPGPGETDPICGMRVEPARAAATSVRDGKTIYFCSVGCRDRFEAGLGPRPMGEQRVTLGVARRPSGPPRR
jgi:YHS domain-containing protein